MNAELREYFRDCEEAYFYTLDGVCLHYYIIGSGKPLIILPGWAAGAEYHCLAISALSQKNTVYILEARGHGDSEAPSYGYRISRLAKDANEFLRHLGLERACWLGHSMGCSILWCYIDLFGQESIEKLILVDQSPCLLANPQDTEQQIRTYAGQHIDLWQFTNAFLSSWEEGLAAFKRYFHLRDYPRPGPDLHRFINKLGEGKKDNVFLAKLHMDHLVQDWRDVIPRIHVPTLYISGDISYATTLESSQWIAGSIKNCRWVRFSSEEFGNHLMMVTNPEKYSRVVSDFINDT